MRRYTWALILFAVSCSSSEKAQPPAAQGPAEDAKPGATPTPSEPSKRAPIARAEIDELLQRWLASQNEGSFAAYEALYADDFQGVRRVGERTSRFDRDGWLKDRKRMFRRKMSVSADDVEVSGVTAAAATVEFTQTWSAGKFKDVGRKRLILQKRAGTMRLVAEEMLDSVVQSTRPIFYTIDAELWRIEADGSNKHRLDSVESFDGIFAGSTSRALVSPDHAWIAFTRSFDLWIRSAKPNTKAKRITRHKGGDEDDIMVFLVGWSPDSRWLLYDLHQEYRGNVDTVPPDGVTLGYYLLDPRTRETEHLERLPGFTAWRPDSKHILHPRQTLGTAHLFLVPIRGAPPGTQFGAHKSQTGFLHQSSIVGEHLAYVNQNDIYFAKLDGTESKKLADGDHREACEAPELSPDASRVACVHFIRIGKEGGSRDVKVIDLATLKPKKVASCEKKCRIYRWHDNTHLLLSEPLRLVDVQSGEERILSERGVVVQVGQP